MEQNQKLNDLLKQVAEIVPTMIFIGLTADKHGAMLMGPPEETDEKRMLDLTAAIAMLMEARAECHEVMLSAVCYYLQQNPQYQEKMRVALDKMKGFTHTATFMQQNVGEKLKKVFDGMEKENEHQ